MNLRKIIVALIYIASPAALHAENVKSNPARVSKATVYLSGAQLTCTAEFQSLPGINQFIFENVSPNIDVNSLQASAKGSIVIMDVRFETKYNEVKSKPLSKPVEKELKQANDSLTMLTFEMEELNDLLSGLTTEKNILLNNRLIKGESTRDTLELFKNSIEFLRSRLFNITAEATSIKKRLHYKNEEQARLQNRIAALSQVSQTGAPVQEAKHTITVMAHADIATTANVSVSFIIQNAAWLPTYDLRANANGTIDLIQKAELRQSSGMDWNNVALTLSTGNPSLGTQKPVLSPFYLSFIQSFNKRLKYNDHKPASANETGAARAQEEEIADALSLAEFTTANEGMIQTEYEIKLKYSIAHGDAMHVVAIQNKTLKADYKYSVVPKLDLSAYLIASLSDWNDMNLIPGASRIYFDGSFIGKSYINPDASEDTLMLSLGKDRSIAVSRKKVKDKTKERVLADDKIITSTYEIIVRNTKSNAITIEVTDQIPVSRDEKIKVELLSDDNADFDSEKGSLTWNFQVKPKDNKKMQFTYEVKIPRDKSLAGL